MTVDDGAGVTVANNLQIDEGGTVTLTGAGSSLSVGGNFIVNSGSYNIDENSTFNVTGETLIGDDDAINSSADATSSPATVSTEGDVTPKADNNWTLRASCVIGDNTKGKLTINSGSTVNANNNNVTLGSQKTGNGTLTVNGDGAALKKIKSLQVGVDGTGTVLIENGGLVVANTSWDGSQSSPQGTRTITVSGSTSSGGLAVYNAYAGVDASGSLAVQNGGAALFATGFVVGRQGHVTVSSNSGIAVGGNGGSLDGSVTIGAGGTVTVDCPNGAYNAKTKISGGTLYIKQSGAIAGADGISFAGAGTLELGIGVTLSNKISGFGSGDTIQLDGVTATKPSYNPSKGTLTLLNGTAPVETLKVAGSYTDANFGVAEVGGNAVVSYRPSKASTASLHEQIFNSALLSDTLAYHPLDAIAGRGWKIGSATPPDLWSVGTGPAGPELGPLPDIPVPLLGSRQIHEELSAA